MYGFAVNLVFRPAFGFRELWGDIAELRDFFRLKGCDILGRERGLPDPGFQAPLLPAERLDGSMTVLDAPTLEFPSDVPATPPDVGFWTCELRGDVRLNDRWFYREMFAGKPMRILLLHVSTGRAAHGVGFWTESHVWLDQPENPLRAFADGHLRALAGRIEAIARRFEPWLEYSSGNFHELKDPFDLDVERLKAAFARVPKFAPNAG